VANYAHKTADSCRDFIHAGLRVWAYESGRPVDVLSGARILIVLLSGTHMSFIIKHPFKWCYMLIWPPVRVNHLYRKFSRVIRIFRTIRVLRIKALRANPRRRGGRLYADGPGWSCAVKNRSPRDIRYLSPAFINIKYITESKPITYSL
jgi:hypothetical protein